MSIQLVIGKLLTDERFRHDVADRGRECLAALSKRGIALDPFEIDALLEIDPQVWACTAPQMDRLLHRVEPTSYSTVPTANRPFTRRQRQVLHAVFEGQTNKQIAAELQVSEGAIKATVQQLFRKARVRTRAQLVRVAIEGGLGTGLPLIRLAGI